MNKPLLVANWKMNKNNKQAISLANQLVNKLKNIDNKKIVICPPFTSLHSLHTVFKDTNISMGAQNCHYEISGAYTGEISAEMLSSLHVEYLILGHSERRAYFNESNTEINKKLILATQNGLKPILCVGESIQERENGNTFNIIENQIKLGLKNFNNTDKLIIAYEPIWAIGTGKVASPQEAEEVHSFIRNLLSKLYSNKIANKVYLLYGGSMKTTNVEGLMKCPNVDGGLIGGASLNCDDFTQLVNLA